MRYQHIQLEGISRPTRKTRAASATSIASGFRGLLALNAGTVVAKVRDELAATEGA
jgi:hypothetical protein